MPDRCHYCSARAVYTYRMPRGRLRRLFRLSGRTLRVCTSCDPWEHKP